MRLGKALIGFCVAALLSLLVQAETAANLNVDWRGLLNVDGICRMDTKSNWGFVNFIAFGPSWQFTAQDYAAKEHRKEAIEDPELGKGLLFTGKIWAGPSGLAIREEFFDVSEGGAAKVHVRWTISSVEGKAMGLQRAYAMFPLAANDFVGGKSGTTVLPEAYGQEFIGIGSDKRSIEVVSKDGTKKLRLNVLKGNAVFMDARKDKTQRFELRLEFPECKTAKSSTIEFVVSGAFADSLKRGKGLVNLSIPPPPFKLVANEDWVPFPYTNEIKPGTILDFTDILSSDSPAGKYGFVRVAPDGHFTFERAPDRRLRLVGANLCFDANFLSREEVAKVVRDFKMRGWNTMRLHHIDVTITEDEWNNLWGRKTLPKISAKKLDQLDYLMAECKKAGIYLTFDLYAMGSLGSCEGFDKPLNSNTIKAVVPIHRPAEDAWFNRAMELFNHVNPYTGIAWKDEPQIVFATLMNEDSIASVWWGAADMYVAKYNEWAKTKGFPTYGKKDIGNRKEFAQFLHEVKAEANRRMGRRLREAGVKTLISGGNWWDTMAQTFEREALDVVDNHQYGDHPQPSYQKLPFHINQTGNIKVGHPTYATPIMMAPTRVFGKPFTVTEYNYCMPNKFRAEGGLMMGAYAALQDWDGLYRFAWSHWRPNMFTQGAANGFDVVTDPLSQMTERQIVLLFGRGDVKRAEKAYAYGVTMEESTERGLGDMWAKGLFPHPFTQLAYTSRVGSFVADKGGKCALPCDAVYERATQKSIPKYPGKGVSDTGEISIDSRVGRLAIATSRTAAVCAFDEGDLSAGPLAVSDMTTFCSVSASAMDGKSLEKSSRILILHLTDVQNTEAQFDDKNMRDLKKWGKLPYLARVGEAKVSLRNETRGLTVWALASDGSRLRKVQATYTDGAYVFTAKVTVGEGANRPTMMYELAK